LLEDHTSTQKYQEQRIATQAACDTWSSHHTYWLVQFSGTSGLRHLVNTSHLLACAVSRHTLPATPGQHITPTGLCSFAAHPACDTWSTHHTYWLVQFSGTSGPRHLVNTSHLLACGFAAHPTRDTCSTHHTYWLVQFCGTSGLRHLVNTSHLPASVVSRHTRPAAPGQHITPTG